MTIERVRELEAALRGMLDFTSGMDGEIYGVFMGGDPRRFRPDMEDCTPEEVAAWRAACKEWDEGRGEDRGPGCSTMGDGSVVTGTGYGIGTTTIVIDEIAEARRVLGLTP